MNISGSINKEEGLLNKLFLFSYDEVLVNSSFFIEQCPEYFLLIKLL